MPKRKLSSQTVGTERYGLSQHSAIRIIAVLQLVFLGISFSPGLTTNNEDAHCFLLGRAIARGAGYADIGRPGNPTELLLPPAYPAFLSIFSVFSATPKLPLAASAFLGVLIPFLFYRLLRRFPAVPLMHLCALVAFSWVVGSFSETFSNAIPYITSVLVAMLLYERSIANLSSRALFLLAIVSSIVPLQCSTLGLSFSAAWIISCFWQRRYRYMVWHIGLALVAVIALRLLTTWHNPYLAQLGLRDLSNPDAGYATAFEMRMRVFLNAINYLTASIPHSMIPLPFEHSRAIAWAVAAALLGVTTMGWIRNLRHGYRFLSVYAVCFMAITLLWQNQTANERLLAGIVPFLLLFMMMGINWVFDLVFSNIRVGSLESISPVGIARFRGVALWTIVVLIAVLNVRFWMVDAKSRREIGPDWANFYTCADWIKTNTPEEAVVATREPDLFYIRSNHHSLEIPRFSDDNTVLHVLESKKTRYVIADGITGPLAAPSGIFQVINSHPELFRTVYSLKNPDTYVMEFKPK